MNYQTVKSLKGLIRDIIWTETNSELPPSHEVAHLLVDGHSKHNT